MTDTAEAPTRSATELAERLFQATIDFLEVASVHLGGELGLYRSLAERGPATSAELAGRTGTVERYVREWLEQQAVAGFLDVAVPDAAPQERRYRLPDQYRPVLVDDDDLNYLTPLASLAVGMLRPQEALLEAYRSGGGLPYDAYDVHRDIGTLNRPQFLHLMAGWLGAVPEIDGRLRAGPPARVADLGCGSAWSSMAIARAYEGVVVDAVDVDEASIAVARENVARAGLADRVRPTVADASRPLPGGPYDLVTIFEAFHDMNHPVAALRAVRASLAPGGSVLIADERVAERFAAPGDEIERFNYGWSILHCLLVGTTEEGAAGTGAVLRPDTVRAYATEAGFGQVEVAPIEHEFWRFYRLVP